MLTKLCKFGEHLLVIILVLIFHKANVTWLLTMAPILHKPPLKVILKKNWNRVLTVSRSPKKQLDTWITVKVFADGSRESSESAIEGRLYRGGFEFPDHVAGRRGGRQ